MRWSSPHCTRSYGLPNYKATNALYKQPAPEAQTYSWLIIAEGDTLQRAVISLKTGLPSPGNGS